MEVMDEFLRVEEIVEGLFRERKIKDLFWENLFLGVEGKEELLKEIENNGFKK